MDRTKLIPAQTSGQIPRASEVQRELRDAEILNARGGWLDSSRQAVTGEELLKKILDMSLIVQDDWAGMAPDRRENLRRCADPSALLELLVAEKLLTPYQSTQLRAGKLTGLVLGNYRILERIGAGGMGVVYKGEHIRMRHVVAIKVLASDVDQNPALLARFYSEMRAVARLHHPNIVAAIDAGETRGEPDEPVWHYFVMEYVQGRNFEEYVLENGPIPPARACQIIYQVATALEEAHKHNLVHRDIKPSNILLTADDQVKLLDFGLAMHFCSRLTIPGAPLGTIEFMSPEQARDASSVDVRADIYSLGATFFWCLTGQMPFPQGETLVQELVARMTQAAPSARALKPEIPPELDAVVLRMMALDPADRYPTPQSVTRALLRFIERDTQLHHARSSLLQLVPGLADASRGEVSPSGPSRRILVVDDEEEIRNLCQCFLQSDSTECDVAADGAAGLRTVASQPYDLVLVDVNMPGMTGLEVVRQLRACPPCGNLKIIVFSGHMQPDEMANLLKAGVDDFLSKPFTGVQLVARVEACLRHKEAEDRSDRLGNLVLTVNAELERNLLTRATDLVQVRNALVMAMAEIAEQSHTLTTGHLVRMQRYCRALAEEAAQLPLFAPEIDKEFIELLACCVPLYDIGMAAVPKHIVQKPEKLTGEERILMQQHTTSGAAALQEVGRQHGSLLRFMQMASDVCRCHHERFDGTGYPNQIRGPAIPLSAKITAFADVYDSLRSWRAHRPAVSHISALQIMRSLSEGHFDPSLLPAFERCGPRFEAIFRDSVDSHGS